MVTFSAVYGLAVIGRHIVTPTYKLDSYQDLLPLIFMMIGGFWVQGLYPGALLHPVEEMRRIFLATTAVFLVMACTTFLWRTAEAYSRSVFLLTWAVGPPLVLLTRQVLRITLARYSWWGVAALMLGSGDSAQRVLRTLKSRTRGVRIIGVLSDEGNTAWPPELPPILGPLNLAPELARSGVANYVIVAMPRQSHKQLRYAIQDFCYGFNHVLLVPDMPGLCSLGVSARDLSGEVALELPQRLFHRSSFIAKRLLDLLLSLTATALLLPILAILASAVYLTSRGGVLYKHERYGKNGKTFSALKFRTMVPNADRVLEDYLARHPEQQFEWKKDHKLKKDPRITPVGRWMRRFSLDELPQLLNVLAGQMSLVGPRPIVKEEIAKYARGYGLYMRVLPGITGLWQVSGRNNTTYAERVAFDEFYVNNWSVWLDIYVLIRTVKVVITAEGAY